MKKILPILSLSVIISTACAQALDLSTAITASDNALQAATSQTAGFLQPGDAASDNAIIKTLHEK
jgi:hypothetical protein